MFPLVQPKTTTGEEAARTGARLDRRSTSQVLRIPPRGRGTLWIAVACDTPHLIGLCISVVNVVQKGSQTV
jgi:hypothetical protein